MKIEQIAVPVELRLVSQRFTAQALRQAYQSPPAPWAGDVCVLHPIARRIPAILIGLVVNLLRS